ncbi:MAG: hypothetical protein Ct9H90mP22_1780 [Gammaproteobacteria bacterium]|nr:MAG: hypothetical protein Ct9H90mP22_1780 [Gammaproteobacteria bacterium]
MFVCTANSLDIPAPFWTEWKLSDCLVTPKMKNLSIAKDYLVKKQLKNNG